MRASAIPAGDYVPTADGRVVTYLGSWQRFEAFLKSLGDQRGPRVAYLDGTLELLSPSKHHERLKSLIGQIVAAYALDEDIEFMAYGSWTLKRKVRDAGAEPDECYIVGSDQDKPRPDLAIEVVWTSGGIDKLEIYRRLEVAEVWLWIKGRIQVHLLREGRYHRSVSSRLFPGLDLKLVASCLDHPTVNRAVRAFRQALARSPSPTVLRHRGSKRPARR